jgi:hypothetical protein
MIFVSETIDTVEGPYDTVRRERTMSGLYPDVDGALQLTEKLRETHRAIVHILHESSRLEPAEASPWSRSSPRSWLDPAMMSG